MPVRYDIAAQVPQASQGGIDPLNMMAALRQQEYQAAQLAALQQRGVYQDQQAQMAAMREKRQAEEAQARQGQVELDTRLKNLEHLRQLSPLVTPQNYPAFVSEVTGRFPEMKPLFPAAYDPETLQKFSLSAEKFYTQFGPREVETIRDGVPGKEQQRFDFASRSYVPVPGSFAPLKHDIQYDEKTNTVIDKTTRTASPITMADTPAAATAPDMTTALIKQREGFIEKPKYDVNAYRAGYGSDTVTLPDGSVQKIAPGMKVSREDAERDLQRRIQTEFVPKAAAKVGEENWARLPENTRAALTSIAYNYGTIPSRIVPAVRSGNPEEIARAIEGLAGDNKGVNAGRRMQEANIARGTAMPGSRAVPAFAAAGAPTFMGGPQIQPPINMMAGAPAPVNAMATPSVPAASVMPQATVMTPPAQPTRPQTLAEYAAKNNPSKPPSKEQGDSYGFAKRIVRDMPILQDQTKIDAGMSTWNRAISNVPFGYGNQWAGKDYQQITQAQRDFINAVLRRESGAAISPQEFENAALQYFPQPGDDPETIQQKLANQRTQLEAIMYGMVPSDREKLQGEFDAQKKKLPNGVRSIEEVR